MQPYNVAAALARKHSLSESQEEVLRGQLAALPDESIRRMESRRGQRCLDEHRETVLRQIGFFGRLLVRLVRRKELWKRNRELRAAARRQRLETIRRAAEWQKR